MYRNRLLSGLASLALSLTLGVGSAAADIVSYTLEEGNSGMAGFPGPYATVSINLTSPTTAEFTYTRLNNFAFVDGGIADANINATSFSVGSLGGTVLQGVNALTIQNPPGDSQVDGFGRFNLVLDNGNAANRMSIVTFTVTRTPMTGTWASAANVLTPNTDGNILAVHIGACTTTDCSGALATTGFATVPIPAAAWLFGSGLIGLIGIARRKNLAAVG